MPVMAVVLGFSSVHNAVGTKRLLAARDELQATEALLNELDEARQELEAAKDWADANWYEDEEEPLPLAAVMERIFAWGDGAWSVAGRAEERAGSLVRGIRLIGGVLEFEGNVRLATKVALDLINGNPLQHDTVDVDPSFADWTPDCFSCNQPLGDWRNAIMLPASETEDDEPNGVCFVHRNCQMKKERGSPSSGG